MAQEMDGPTALLYCWLFGWAYLVVEYDIMGVCLTVHFVLLLIWIYLWLAPAPEYVTPPSSRVSYKRSTKKRAVDKKAKQLKQTKKWDLYTPQKYYDDIISKIDSSNTKEVEDVLDKLDFIVWNSDIDSSFNYHYFDKFPIYYLENKANELKVKVPKRFKKTEYRTRSQVKKAKIIELLIKKKWRIETKKEEQVVLRDWESMTLNELKLQLKAKNLPVGGKKADLVARCKVQLIRDGNVKKNLVTGLDDFKLDRMDLIIKKLRHKNRRVRKAAAFALPPDVALQNLEDRNFYRNALEESLPNVVRDLRQDDPELFTSQYLDPNMQINWKTEAIRKRLDKLSEDEWELKMASMSSSRRTDLVSKLNKEEVAEPTEEVNISFKEWSKKNKDKTFSDYKTEVLGK